MKMTTVPSRALDKENICRFCLTEDGRLVSIFKEDDLRDEDERLPVATRIMSITPVEVHEGDGLPELACQKCIQLLDQACQFRDQVERSDALLRHHYGRLWPETNPQLQKLLKDDKVVKKNLNAEFPQIESGEMEAAATCEVTFKQDHDDSYDNSQSPNYDDDDDEPQDYTMDDEEYEESKLEPEDLTERPTTVTPPYAYLDMSNLKSMFQEQQEPISLALRETQNTNAPKIQPSPLTIPNISVSLIRKNNIAREAQAQAQAQSQAQSKSRRWRKTNEPCTICGKCFKDRFAMKVHLRTHSGEKPFVCMVCGKAFRQKAHLGKHSYTHSAQRKQSHPQPIAPSPASHRPTLNSPQSQQINQQVSNSSLQAPSSTTSVNSVEVKAKLARLSTSIQAKPAPKSDLQALNVPIPVLPRLQKQTAHGMVLSPPRTTSPHSDQASSCSPSYKAQTEPLSLVPKTLSPPVIPKVVPQSLVLAKPMLTVPQITPKAAHVSSASPSAVAFYVMANGLLNQNMVVGNGPGLKKS